MFETTALLVLCAWYDVLEHERYPSWPCLWFILVCDYLHIDPILYTIWFIYVFLLVMYILITLYKLK